MNIFIICLVVFVIFVVIKYGIKYSTGHKVIISGLTEASKQIALFVSEEALKCSCNPFSYENKQIENILKNNEPCYENYLYRAFYFHALWTHQNIFGQHTELSKSGLYHMAKCICNTPDLLTAFYDNFTELMYIYGRIIEDEKIEKIKNEKTKEQVAKDLLNIVLFYNSN